MTIVWPFLAGSLDTSTRKPKVFAVGEEYESNHTNIDRQHWTVVWTGKYAAAEQTARSSSCSWTAVAQCSIVAAAAAAAAHSYLRYGCVGVGAQKNMFLAQHTSDF